MFKKIASAVSNAAVNTFNVINNNKGKIALTVAAVGVAVYYRDQIAEVASGLLEKSGDAASAVVSSAE